MPLIVRPEEARDHPAVYGVNRRAFGRPQEADLVEALREVARASLVAEEEGEIVGHVLFTAVMVVGAGRSAEAAALGPIAVLPERQGRGVGSALVREGLDACRRLEEEVVFVLGDPDYYPRFGFRALAGTGLHCRYVDEGDPAFMAAELASGALERLSGCVRYHPEFDRA